MPTIKQSVQGILDRLGVHQRLKASSLYDLYWNIADKRLIEARRSEVHFYRDLLQGFRHGDLIFDIGANVGIKTDVYLRLGARVVSIEPDESNQKILREKFHKLRLIRKPVSIVGKAVSDKIASETMWIDGPGSALNTLSQKWVEALRENKERFAHTQDNLDFAHHKLVETTTLEHLISTHGLPFFVKIDVEGHEANVLRGLKHPVPFLSFEINLPEFRPEGLDCIKLLDQLASDGKFNYSTDCRRGLALQQWLDAKSFAPILAGCDNNAIEVFWRTALPTTMSASSHQSPDLVVKCQDGKRLDIRNAS
jgi:FkbM family methyltransferase